MGKQITKNKRSAILEKTSGRCAYCGALLLPGRWHVEHVLPKSKGGTDRFSNLLPSCRRCNARKKTKTLEEFRLWPLVRAINMVQEILCVLYWAQPLAPDDSMADLIEQFEKIRDIAARTTPIRFYFETLDNDNEQ